jgi:hypothetical protein
MNRTSRFPLLAAGLGAIFLASTFALATPEKKASTALEDRTLAFSGDPNKPRRHFRAKDVADLSDNERETLYREIRDRLQAGYSVSESSTAKGYLRWTRVNTAPYRSATHGLRFVNNYINSIASPYLKYEKAGALPVGAIIAKDSFVVAKNGALTPGPLFVMEKMKKGFSYVSGDWRYSMVMPDGSFFGATNGENAKRVEFCIGCHLAREKYDHLYFVPANYRKR